MKKEQTKAVAKTDEQIEAGLAACSSADETGCKKCPYAPFKLDNSCLYSLLVDALAYIQRLKAKETKPSCFCTNNMPADCDGCKCEFECTNTYKPRWDMMPYETEKKGRTCYCTDKVPETDCEGCNFVLTCTNTYGLSEVKK